MPESPARAALSGCRVLVARPAHQAQALCAMIEAEGGSACLLPLLAIVPVADPAAVSAQLSAARSAQRWIFSSSNAVRHAAALVERPWPPVAAVGAVTAAALEALGLADVLRPLAGDGAAALLADPAFSQPREQRITLIAGARPLPLLARVLRERGARVEAIAVYRRQPVAHAPQRVAQLIAGVDVAIVPSAEALTQLVRLTPPEAHTLLFDLQLALPSSRVVEKARGLGFRKPPLRPQRVSDAAYVEALRHYRKPAIRIAH